MILGLFRHVSPVHFPMLTGLLKLEWTELRQELLKLLFRSQAFMHAALRQAQPAKPQSLMPGKFPLSVPQH